MGFIGKILKHALSLHIEMQVKFHCSFTQRSQGAHVHIYEPIEMQDAILHMESKFDSNEDKKSNHNLKNGSAFLQVLIIFCSTPVFSYQENAS